MLIFHFRYAKKLLTVTKHSGFILKPVLVKLLSKQLIYLNFVGCFASHKIDLIIQLRTKLIAFYDL